MFLPCPHCNFLVAHHPQLRPLPRACPNCGRPLHPDPDDGAADGAPIAPRPQPVPSVVPAGPVQPPPAAAEAQDPDAAPAPAVEDSADTAVEQSADSGNAEAAADTAQDEAVEEEAAEAAAAADADAEADADAQAGTSGPPHAGQGPVHAEAQRPDTAGPSFAPADRLARWRWPLVAVLALLLVVQSLLADRARLAAHPQWRPLVSALCTVLRCELAPWREPAALRMLDRKVRAVPDASGALRVDATFRNEARWAQAWPALQLTLADADGRTLASGIFAPEDYLGVAPDTLLAPGQSAQVSFLVREPAPGTVAFAFRFR